MPLDSLPTYFEANLLPPNASRFMRATEEAMRVPHDLWDKAALIPSAKTLLPDDVLPFLIWEYGLEPVARWIDDRRLVLREGRKWQRIRGTNDAALMALGWIDFVPLLIEEHPQETWWDMYQLGFHEAETDADRLDAIFALTRLSKPAHGDLIRAYDPGYDLRPVIINGEASINGPALINDWSGIWLREGWPKISFSRREVEVLTWGVTADAIGIHHVLASEVFTSAHGFIINAHRINSDELIDPSTSVAEMTLAEASEAMHFYGAAGGGYSVGPWPDAPWGETPAIQIIDFDIEAESP